MVAQNRIALFLARVQLESIFDELDKYPTFEEVNGALQRIQAVAQEVSRQGRTLYHTFDIHRNFRWPIAEEQRRIMRLLGRLERIWGIDPIRFESVYTGPRDIVVLQRCRRFLESAVKKARMGNEVIWRTF